MLSVFSREDEGEVQVVTSRLPLHEGTVSDRRPTREFLKISLDNLTPSFNFKDPQHKNTS